MTESELEHLALKWFQDTGWDYRAGLDIAPDSDAPERRDYRQVLLQSELRAALTLLNHQTPTAVLDEVAHQLAKPEHPSLIQSNRAFHEALVSGVSVEVEIAGERRGDRVQLVDFENPERNHFLVVSQFTVQGGKRLRRADLVCFINGLPLAVIEPKNPAAAQAGIKDAFRQLQTYKEEMSDLFVFNEALVASDGLQARIGSLTASFERFLPWHTVKNENDRPLQVRLCQAPARRAEERHLCGLHRHTHRGRGPRHARSVWRLREHLRHSGCGGRWRHGAHLLREPAGQAQPEPERHGADERRGGRGFRG